MPRCVNRVIHHHEAANCAILTVPQAPNYQDTDRMKDLFEAK